MTISGYDCWKRKGLSRRRKLENVGAETTSSGSPFQIRGPETLKVRLPTVDSRNIGTTRRLELTERIADLLLGRVVYSKRCTIANSVIYIYISVWRWHISYLVIRRATLSIYISSILTGTRSRHKLVRQWPANKWSPSMIPEMAGCHRPNDTKNSKRHQFSRNRVVTATASDELAAGG